MFSSGVGKICWRRDRLPTQVFLGFPCGSADKDSICNVGDLGSIPGLGRSPAKGKGYPLQYSSLENSMDCTGQEVAKSRTWLSDFHFHIHTLYSVQFSHSVVSDSLQPHGLQHTRPPRSSPTPGVYPNSCPFSWWWRPTIPSFVLPFSSCPQSFPASGSFPISWLFPLGGQSIGASASASVLSMSIHHWFPLGLTGLISNQDLRV